MKFPLAADVELAFFRQIWEKSDDPFWLCECVGEDFVLAAINPAERVIDPRLQHGLSIVAYLSAFPETDQLISGYYDCRNTGRTISFRQQITLKGEERLFQTMLVPVTNEKGIVTHLCGTSRDMSEYLRTQRAQEEFSRQLERQVAERTEALNAANAELREANRILERLASSDSLTELDNRRCFFEKAAAEVERARRYGHPLSLQMLDIDHFKAINDRYGHVAGDHVLMALAEVLRANLRHSDVAARLGGEEFAILLPETNVDEAFAHAERIRQSVARLSVLNGTVSLSLTVSIGVAALGAGDSSIESVLMRADSCLYRAKQEGRNRVCVDRTVVTGCNLSLF
jgi:diguanylate cyclase (GGDEF)-like protein